MNSNKYDDDDDENDDGPLRFCLPLANSRDEIILRYYSFAMRSLIEILL
jgi:hypothetical protein